MNIKINILQKIRYKYLIKIRNILDKVILLFPDSMIFEIMISKVERIN